MKNLLVNFSFISVQELNSMIDNNSIELSDYEKESIEKYDPKKTELSIPYNGNTISDYSVYVLYDEDNPLYLSLYNSFCFMKDIVLDSLLDDNDISITLSGELEDVEKFKLIPDGVKCIIDSLFENDKNYILSI